MEAHGPLRKAGIQCRKIGDERLFYDAETGAVHITNATAESVWNMCDGQHTLDKMQQRLAQAYDVPAEADLRKDLQDVIQSFADCGMLASLGTWRRQEGSGGACP